MKVTEKDRHALIAGIADFNIVLMKEQELDGETPYEFSLQVELPDAGYALHLEATYVPRGAMVISPSGTPVHGPPPAADIERCKKAFPGFAVGPPWCGRAKGHAGDCDDWVSF